MITILMFAWLVFSACFGIAAYFLGKNVGFGEGEKAGWQDSDKEMNALRKNCDILIEEVKHWYEVAAGCACGDAGEEETRETK